MSQPASLERAARIRRLFDDLVELTPDERAHKLQEACRDDTTIRREVEVLLSAYDRGDDILQSLVSTVEIKPAPEVDSLGLVGSSLSHYQIETRLGAGGMGVVYKARDTKLARDVALKFLSPHLITDTDARQRFIHEARAASALDHPNIATVYEIDETGDGRLFIAMAFYRGKTLNERIDKGPLPVDEGVDITLQVARGLERAHEAGIVHRDIKPANLMQTDRELVKILDFGLAKIADVHLTRTGTTMGTVAYMSPEQVRGQAVDHRTDLWSLGIVLYEMLTGKRPFQGEHEQAILFSILHEQPVSARSKRSEIPVELERIINKLLQKSTEDRYQKIKEVAADLELLRGRHRSKYEAIHTTRTGWSRNRRLYLFAVIAVTFLVLLSIGFFFVSHQPEKVGSLSEDQKRIAVAVLPLANLSRDLGQEYFSDGMTDALINDLGTVGALKVISRTSVMRYKNSEQSLPEIARELSVSHIIEGSVLQAEGKVRISARLIEAAVEQQLWAGSYEEELKDVLTLQRKVARSIVRGIGVQLTARQQAHLEATPTANPEAYTAYLQGLHFWNNRPPTGPAIQYFEKAIALDPDFALAHAMLGGCYAVGADGRYSRFETGRRAREAIGKALALEATTAEAYNMLGWVQMYFDWDWEGAAASFEKALELNPSYADAFHRYAHYLMNTGRVEEALEASWRAQELDPFDQQITAHQVWDPYMTRQYERAVASSRKILEADPTNQLAIIYALPAYEQLGQYDHILDATSNRVLNFDRGRALALTGRRAEAEQIIREMVNRQDEHFSRSIALIYTALGDRERAFEWLEKAVSARLYPLPEMRIDPRFDPLRSDPRFDSLLARMGLEPYDRNDNIMR